MPLFKEQPRPPPHTRPCRPITQGSAASQLCLGLLLDAQPRWGACAGLTTDVLTANSLWLAAEHTAKPTRWLTGAGLQILI